MGLMPPSKGIEVPTHIAVRGYVRKPMTEIVFIDYKPENSVWKNKCACNFTACKPTPHGPGGLPHKLFVHLGVVVHLKPL